MTTGADTTRTRAAIAELRAALNELKLGSPIGHVLAGPNVENVLEHHLQMIERVVELHALPPEEPGLRLVDDDR